MVAARFSLRCIYRLTVARDKILPVVTHIWRRLKHCGYHADNDCNKLDFVRSAAPATRLGFVSLPLLAIVHPL